MRWRSDRPEAGRSQRMTATSQHLLAARYDRALLWSVLGLWVLGLVMVTSAAMPLGQQGQQDPFLFTKRSLFYSSIALLLSLVTLQFPMRLWQRLSVPMLLISMLLLLLVLIVGNTANGAVRWITIYALHIQPAELAKLSLFCYLSGYLVRKAQGVRNNFWDFCKPFTVMLLLAVLLLAQPDLGTVIVLFVTSLLLLFLAGARVWQLLAIVVSGLLALGLLIMVEPYRVRRIIAFFDPWKDPYGSGYQLTQSLMAFGRGDYFGQGLGNGLQKLAYLPEAHTDFIFAVLAEELGYCGVALVLVLFSCLIGRALIIGQRALKSEQRFCGFLACSIGIWLSLQVIINVGAAVGLLPTKGLSFPLLSYGGSNLLVVTTAVVMLLRIDFEMHCAQAQAHVREDINGR